MFRTLAVMVAAHLAISQGFSIQPKIVNGDVINATVPFFVSIGNMVDKCSASLISDLWILTAGHCLRYAIPIEAHFGIGPDGTFEAIELTNTLDHYIYPGFANDPKRHDIGLIKLPHPLRFGRNIHAVKLPQTCDDPRIGETMRAIGSGWSQFEQQFNESDGLVRHVALKLVDIESSPFLLSYGYSVVPSVFFTTSPDTVYRSTMPGDSGGPLIRQSDGVQFGVAKSNFAPPHNFHGYTKLSYFFDWISNVTGLSLPKCPEQAPVDGNVASMFWRFGQ